MGPKGIWSKSFSLYIVKFKKLGFSAPLSPFSKTEEVLLHNQLLSIILRYYKAISKQIKLKKYYRLLGIGKK